VTRLAVGSISGSPEITGRIAGRRASRRFAADFSIPGHAFHDAHRGMISQLLAGRS
jgi:hypothetical protein